MAIINRPDPDGGVIVGMIADTSDSPHGPRVTVVDFGGHPHTVPTDWVETPDLGTFVDRWCETIADAVDGPATLPPPNYRRRQHQQDLLWRTLCGFFHIPDDPRLNAQTFVQAMLNRECIAHPATRMVRLSRKDDAADIYVALSHITRVTGGGGSFASVYMLDGNAVHTSMSVEEVRRVIAAHENWSVPTDLVAPSEELIEV
jgi:hypothetical protein